MKVHPGRGRVLAHVPANDLDHEQHPSCCLSCLSSCTSTVTDICTSLASSAVRATAPNATNPACTPGTIPSATCSSHAPRTTLPGNTSSNSSTPSHTTSSTTPALRLSPWWLGPDVQLLSSPCETVPNRLPTRPMAALPAVLCRSIWSW